MKLYLINYVKVDEREFRERLREEIVAITENRYQAFWKTWKVYCEITNRGSIVFGNCRYKVEEVR